MEQEFPFEELVQALNSTDIPLSTSLADIIKAVTRKNIEWTYSVMSTLIEILKSKEEEPIVLCQCLSATALLLHTCEYPLITFFQAYQLPIVFDIALYHFKKTQEQTAYYFQKSRQLDDSPEMRELSKRFVKSAVEIIYYVATVKPYRTVDTDELKQSSSSAERAALLEERRIGKPQQWKWVHEEWIRQDRKRFLQRLRRFNDEAEEWIEFLLMNLLDEIRSNKKDLLQLRQLLGFGESFLTSAVINFCQEQLLELSEEFEHKKKYLGVLNQLVREGDMEAIITIKNSEFVPGIAARVSQVQGQSGTNKGEGILPEIQASKQVKREFYVQFLRSVENWAQSMPPQYDADHFKIKDIYKFLKIERQFKFPDNLHLARFQKEVTANLERNKERNAKIIELLQNVTQNSRASLSRSKNQPASKMSNVLQQSVQQVPNSVSPAQLKMKLQHANQYLKKLTSNREAIDKAFEGLVPFKDNWINYLQSLNLEQADEDMLEELVVSGEKCVEQIQLIVPLHTALRKGKISEKQFHLRVSEMLQFHHDLSVSRQPQQSSKNPKSLLASRLKSRHSKIAGKSLLSKIKSKSRVDTSRLDASKVIDRSQFLSKSKSKIVDKSKQDIKKPIKQSEQKRQSSEESLKKQPESLRESPRVVKKQSQKTKSIHQSNLSKDQSSSLNASPVKPRLPQQGKNTTKQSVLPGKDSQVDKLVRIDDYEPQRVQRPKRHTTHHQENDLSHNRQKGSRILLRRSASKGSRLSVSGDSRLSGGQRSLSGCRKLKESSIGQNRLNRTKKVSEIEDELGAKKMDQTIGVNGNVWREGKKSRAAWQQECNFIKDGVGEISSIHSNSQLHQSAQKVLLNITAREELNTQYPHQREQVSLRAKAEEESGGGDYYMQSAKVSHQQTPKKQQQQTQSVYSHEDPQFKTLFTKRGGNELTQRKVERRQPNSTQTVHKYGSQKLSEARSVEMKTQSIEKPAQAERHSRPANKWESNTERNLLSTSRSIDMRAIESEKNKEIAALQKKIRDLEKESIKMKTRLTAMDNELKSIKSGSQNGSQRGYPQFTAPSQSNYEKSSARGSSAGRKKGEMTRFQREVESGYMQYLQKIKGSTFRKSLLKMKCLVHKSDELEVGCLSQRGEHVVESTLYITPHRYDLCDFTLQLIHDNNLKIKAVPQVVKKIPCRKQQKVHLTIEVLRIPFCLPEIEINYKTQSEYSSSYNRLTLPLAFNKFTDIRPLDPEQQSQRHTSFVRSDNFKLNLKVVKQEKLAEAFPTFALIPPSKDRPQVLLAASCSFVQSKFNLLLNIQEKSSWIEGFLKEGDIKAMNFLLCTLKQLLDSSKK